MYVLSFNKYDTKGASKMTSNEKEEECLGVCQVCYC